MYDKVKSEQYSNLGGINNKASPYVTAPTEFLNLYNFDFSVPGALTQRLGSTHWIVGGNASFSFGVPITGLYEFTRLSGASYQIFEAGQTLYAQHGNVVNAFASFGTTGPASFVTFVDRLFFGNGSSGPMQKFDGSTATNYSLPAPTIQSVGAPYSIAGTTGLFQVAVGFVNDAGYFGPPGPAVGVSLSTSLGSATFLVYVPPGYGINSVVTYISNPNGSELFVSFNQAVYAVGSTLSYYGLIAPLVLPPQLEPTPQYGLFFTLSPKYLEIYNNQLWLAGLPVSYGMTNSYNPPPLSITTVLYNYQSTVFWSGIGQPEFIDPSYFNEFRTNNGDIVTGLKFYNNSLIVFKNRSFFQLTAASETDIFIRSVSDQYGCLSNRAAVVYNQLLLFLDQKGIAMYDGANVAIISNKVESIFQRMNIDSAVNGANAIHFKKRNEVWFNIPVDGSLTNNISVIYDYLMNAWTTYGGYQPASMALFRSGFSDYTNFYGDYSGIIYYFGVSLPADNQQGLTLIANTFFHTETEGSPHMQSVTKQWRRLFLNNSTSNGSSSFINIGLVPDYGTSAAVSVPMYLGQFQSRIDFGIPSKSLQVQFSSFSSTLFVKIFGYTVESRYQRSV